MNEIEELIQMFRLLTMDKVRAQLEDDFYSDTSSKARQRFAYVRDFVSLVLKR